MANCTCVRVLLSTRLAGWRDITATSEKFMRHLSRYEHDLWWQYTCMPFYCLGVVPQHVRTVPCRLARAIRSRLLIRRLSCVTIHLNQSQSQKPRSLDLPIVGILPKRMSLFLQPLRKRKVWENTRLTDEEVSLSST